uniref:type II secretion system F family protein n=1 Tax=Pararhizobium sp. IMCC3301 TaxID=3067904 RepID=UPI0027424B9B|nr:type II secretion system F family protein [Pararhizobium sp. IMCC3301]
MSENLILLTTFISVMMIAAIIFGLVNARRQISARFDDQTEDKPDEVEVPEDIRGLSITEATLVKHYYAVIRADKNQNSVDNRLIRAGYFQPGAGRTYQLIRVVVALAFSSLIMFGVPLFLPDLLNSSLIMLALITGALAFFVCNIMLEKIGDSREVMYRRLFPDFMDTLIVCVDSGLSVEAAIDRVSKEFLKSVNKDFGLHLAMMMLEVRGGRRLRDALSNFAGRLRIDEAKSLAVLFRQSEELGASVTKTLRVFSGEMREKRMISAEEKANALPFKMLFPLALFLFPISILIVAVPIIMKVISVLQSLAG